MEGAVIVLVFGAALAAAIIAPVIGLSIGAALLCASAAMVFAAARSGVHEVSAAVLLVGAFLCAGFAALIRSLAGVTFVGERMAEKVRGNRTAPAPAMPTPVPPADVPEAAAPRGEPRPEALPEAGTPERA